MTELSLGEESLDIYPAKHFKHEHSYLLSLINPEVLELLEESRAMLCGGAITSLMTGQEVNDLDIYFRSREQMEDFIFKVHEREKVTFFEDGSIDNNENLVGKDGKVLSNSIVEILGATDKSVMYNMSGSFCNCVLQIIAFDIFPNPAVVFSHFDYRINMGCFDFFGNEWKFDKHFLHDLSQRRLVFNQGTNFPIISLLRMGKYQGRGYHISKKDVMALGIKTSTLEMKSWDDAKRHLSGFYGTSIDQLISGADSKEFSIENLTQCIEDAEDDYLSQIATEGNRKRPDFTKPSSYEIVASLRKTLGGGNLYKEAYLICPENCFSLFSEKDKPYYITKELTTLPERWNELHKVFPSLKLLTGFLSGVSEERKKDLIVLKLSLRNPDEICFDGVMIDNDDLTAVGLRIENIVDFNLEEVKEKDVGDPYSKSLPF